MTPSPSIEKLAKELRNASIKQSLWEWENLSKSQQTPWIKVARHVMRMVLEAKISAMNEAFERPGQETLDIIEELQNQLNEIKDEK